MSTTARTQPQLLTIDEAAELLRTSVSTLRWWRHRRTGPASFRIGRRVVYDRTDVEAYIAAQRDASWSTWRAV